MPIIGNKMNAIKREIKIDSFDKVAIFCTMRF